MGEDYDDKSAINQQISKKISDSIDEWVICVGIMSFG